MASGFGGLGVIREAGPQDRRTLDAFLLAHIDVAMFPMSNLRAHGIGQTGFASDHPNAARYWLVGPGISGVIAVTRRGMILAVLPGGVDLGVLPTALARMMITGAVGEAAATRHVLAALSLGDRATRRDQDEPGFSLTLANLVVPDAVGAQLIPACEDWRKMLIDWRTAYNHELLGTPVEKATTEAEGDVSAYIQTGSHRVLLRSGAPVAMTGFNAALPEIVQIGGVYVPPDLRGRGHARLAVALHLQQARAQGVGRAVLFAASDTAARAYQAIGFQPAGKMAVVLFESTHQVRA